MHNAKPTGIGADKPASWLAISSLAVGSFALVTTEFIPVGLIPAIATEIGITHGQAGLAITVPGFVAALAAPLSITFAGKTDRRHILWILLGLLVLSNLLVATSTGLLQLLSGRILLGVSVGSFWTIAGSLGSRLRPGPEGIRANALILSGISLGTVAGVPAGALIGEIFGWRMAFFAAAGLSTIAIVAILTLLPSISAKSREEKFTLHSVLSERTAQVALTAAVLIFIGQFAAYTYITPFLNAVPVLSGNTLSIILLANGIAGFFGNLTGGWISSRNTVASVVLTYILLGGSISLLTVVGSSPVASVVLVVIWGFSFGMLPISMQTWLGYLSNGRRDEMQAIFVSLVQAAIGTGSLLGGVIVDHLNIEATMIIGGLAALSILPLVIAAAWRQKQSDDDESLQPFSLS
jgi:predicted MFS family arabinose efflux permease